MMAALEMNPAGAEEDQKEKTLSPSEEDSSKMKNDTSAPLNFSELTPCQFGISVQSFTPASLSNRKDKSRLAQIKARRKSSIGVRGSPETNSLIRFMAQQRMKTPPGAKTPEPVKSSPFLPRVASTLRQKIASFHTLMDVEESEGCDPEPKQDSNTGGCNKTRDYLSDGSSCEGGKENYPPTVTPSKRRRLGPLESCEVEIREASAPMLHFSLKEREEEEKTVTQVVTQGPSREAVEETETACISHVLFKSALRAVSPPEKLQDGVFELQNPRQTPPDDPAAASPAQPASSLHIPSLPSLLEMKPTGEGDATGVSTVQKKKKKVRFGGPLSPEFFDKNLPPSTPLQKGGTPARAQTPGGSLQLRSLLKTPQGSESKTPNTQLDLNSPTVFGASPTLAIPRNRRTPAVGEDNEDEDGKIIFPAMEEIDSAVTADTECIWDVQPLNLDVAFHEECLRQTVTESVSSSAAQMDASEESTSLPEEKQPEADVEVESRSRRRKQPGAKSESSSEASARSSSRKRKLPEESEPVKRSTRSAAKSASGKMKIAAAARRWNKDVDRSLYGSRAYASKNPTLSPITERLSFSWTSPAAQQTLSTTCPAPDQEPLLISEVTLTNTLENPSEDSITSLKTTKQDLIRRGRRKARERGQRKMKVSVGEEIVPIFNEETLNHTGGAEENCEEQTATNLEASEEAAVIHTEPEQKEADTELNTQTSAGAQCTHSEGKLESHANPDGSTSSNTEPNNTVSLPTGVAPRKYKKGRRSSLYGSVLQEQENQTEEHQTSCAVEETGQVNPESVQQECSSRSSSDGQEEEEEVPKLDLAPWQTDFNFEDVFQPVASRGQRSVRRSLRNQNSRSAGLAWLPWTSPDSNKESRRRTKGRRLSAALPVQPSVPEETQDNAS